MIESNAMNVTKTTTEQPMHVLLFFNWVVFISESNSCVFPATLQCFIISNRGRDKHMLDSTWSSEVMLQCWLVISKKKSAAYQMKPHLKEPCFCRTPRPSAAYPGSPSWTYPGSLSCTPRCASPRRGLPPASGLKRCDSRKIRTNGLEGRRRRRKERTVLIGGNFSLRRKNI